jgi:CDP-glycerol glycerophosphotransferase
MQRAYLRARVISVLGSYDAYFIRLREGSQTSRKDQTDDIGEAILRVERDRILPVVEHFEAGPRRDHLLRQHVAKVAGAFGRRWAALDPADQARVFETGADVAKRWTSPAIERALAPKQRVRLYCLLHGLLAELRDIAVAPAATVFGAPVVDRGRIYAAYPHFRDASGIPDECFDMTRRVNLKMRVDNAYSEDGHVVVEGSAWLNLVGGRPLVRLRRWPAGPEVSIEVVPVATPYLSDRTRSYPEAGFHVEIDLATADEGGPVPSGIWDVLVGAQAEGITRKGLARLASGSARARGVHRRPGTGPDLVFLRGGRLQLHVPPVPVVVKLAERVHRRSIRLRRAAARVRTRRPHR